MPCFDRLLVIAVLALSASVRSAPVGADTGYGVVPTEGGLVPAPGVDQGGVVHASSDGGDLFPADEDTNTFDERDFNEDDDDDLDEDDDLETRDFYDEDALERRAGKKTKSPSKPKATKSPKPKTTKALTPPKTKTTKPKTTKVKTKTTAKATTTKPAKTPKVKPTKTAKVTTKPAKTKTPKAPSKASKTTKATGTAVPSACPIKKPSKKPRAFASRAYDYVAHLFERDSQEFVGWHGTNSDTAAFWESKGHIEKPVKADGFLDFLGIGSKVTKGTSGANAEVGPGLYLADEKDTSIGSAHFNAQKNPGTTPALCAIFAKSSGNWRNVIRKAFIPENIVGDTPEKEAARVAHVKTAVPGVTESTVVRFALLKRTGKEEDKTGQMLIPESVANQFFAKCFKVDGEVVAASDDAASKVGTETFPAFEYKGAKLRDEWKIAPENAGGCS